MDPVQHQPYHEGSELPPRQGCPRGLEYLTLVDQLIINQSVEMFEAFTGFETNNRYVVKNSVGQPVYHAVEDTDCCTRNVCGSNRAFDIKIFDNGGQEVIKLHRPLRGKHCFTPCCLQEMKVQSPPGNTIGYIVQRWTLCHPSFWIQDDCGNNVLRIDGPCLVCGFMTDVKFVVSSVDGQHEVGQITKQWSGWTRELFTDADNFGVVFPMNMDVRVKASVLASAFLIDFMYYEQSGGGFWNMLKRD